MEIMEIAALLGQKLKEDARLVKLEEARKAYEGSKELQKNMLEYEVQQKALQSEVTKEDKDTHFIEIIQKRIDELYNAITKDPVFMNLNDIQSEVNELMNEVNNTIMFNITGETPCTHDCSTCGGGCGHHH